MVNRLAKWRKKPVVIDAEQYKEGLEDGWECELICRGICTVTEEICEGKYCDVSKPYIKSLEGNHKIKDGDYIITGIKGERYVCDEDIFLLTYEQVKGGE